MLRKFLTSFAVLAIINFSVTAQTNSAPPLKSDTALAEATVAQESSTPVITGSVDMYYRYNFSDVQAFAHSNNFTSFTNSHNSFELGLASIRGDHSFGKASATVDLGFGRRAEEFSYGNPANQTLFAIKQAYLSYAISDKFKLTMGKWATHVGYELVDAYLNRNYSMSYMFSYGPFSHTGLKAEFSVGGKSALMVGVANSTDSVSSVVSPKFILGQFSTASSDNKLKAFLNFQAGSNGSSNKLIQGDIVLNYGLSDKFSLGYNGTVQSKKFKDFTTGKYSDADSWWGSALYVNYDPTSIFGITLRGEYFDDKKDVIGFGTSILAITLSPNFKVGNLTIIPELRLDNSKGEIFQKNDGAGSKNTISALLAATYHF